MYKASCNVRLIVLFINRIAVNVATKLPMSSTAICSICTQTGHEDQWHLRMYSLYPQLRLQLRQDTRHLGSFLVEECMEARGNSKWALTKHSIEVAARYV